MTNTFDRTRALELLRLGCGTPAAAFRELYFGSSRASARLRNAVQVSLLGSMARTNRALTRFISQAKLDASHKTEKQLEVVLHSQLVS